MIWRLLLLLALLSATDGALTVDEVTAGIATELNPLMAAVLPLGILAVLAVKVLPIALLTAFPGHVPLRAVKALTGIYGVVLGYHVWGLLS